MPQYFQTLFRFQENRLQFSLWLNSSAEIPLFPVYLEGHNSVQALDVQCLQGFKAGTGVTGKFLLRLILEMHFKRTHQYQSKRK